MVTLKVQMEEKTRRRREDELFCTEMTEREEKNVRDKRKKVKKEEKERE